jgi:hypothetical protein
MKIPRPMDAASLVTVPESEIYQFPAITWCLVSLIDESPPHTPASENRITSAPTKNLVVCID